MRASRMGMKALGAYLLLFMLLLLMALATAFPALAQGSQAVTVSVSVPPCVRVFPDGSVAGNIPISSVPGSSLLTVIAL